jgi:NTE family protein
MLSFQNATQPRSLSQTHKVGLAIAGGGPIGGIYELGALRALEELIDGITLTRLDAYVGVSSGAIMAAALANRIDTAEMCRILLSAENAEHPFHPDIFLKPALHEYARRIARTPSVVAEMLGAYLKHPWTRSSVIHSENSAHCCQRVCLTIWKSSASCASCLPVAGAAMIFAI